jgi:hypothetical protein
MQLFDMKLTGEVGAEQHVDQTICISIAWVRLPPLLLTLATVARPLGDSSRQVWDRDLGVEDQGRNGVRPVSGTAKCRSDTLIRIHTRPAAV